MPCWHTLGSETSVSLCANWLPYVWHPCGKWLVSQRAWFETYRDDESSECFKFIIAWCHFKLCLLYVQKGAMMMNRLESWILTQSCYACLCYPVQTQEKIIHVNNILLKFNIIILADHWIHLPFLENDMALPQALEYDRPQQGRLFRDHLNPFDVSSDHLLHHQQPRQKSFSCVRGPEPQAHSRTRAIQVPHTDLGYPVRIIFFS